MILYKAQRLDNKEWVEGYYQGSFHGAKYDFQVIWFRDDESITGDDWIEIDPSTLQVKTSSGEWKDIDKIKIV